MTINFTIFVQIINFIIGYFIISRFLLKPAIAIIHQDSKNENNLLEAIKVKEENIVSKKNLKSDLWIKALNKFAKSKPLLEKDETKIVWKIPVAQEISIDLKKSLESEINSLIINRMKHVKQ